MMGARSIFAETCSQATVTASLVGADYAVSKNNADDEIGSSTVTLSAAKGLSRWAERCFAALSMTVL